MFSALLGLAGSAFSAFSSMSAANSAAAAANYQADVAEAARQQQQQFNNYLIGRNEDYYRDQLSRYYEMMDLYNRDRLTRESEAQFSRNLLMEDRSQKSAEYAAIVDRQIALDRDAARQRAFQLEQYIRAQNISAAERAVAMQELRNAQAIAAGERDADLNQYYQTLATRQSERQFQIDELRKAQQISMANRDFAVDNRRRYDTATDELRDVTRNTLAQLGDIREIPELTAKDINAETDKRTALYERAIDRAAKMASSQNEAALIRGGVDSSSTGATRRAEVAGQIAPMYEQAYQRAADDALKYMTGVQSTLFSNYDKDLARRAQVLNETRLPITSYLESLARTPGIGGEMGIGPSFANVGSSAYDRAIRSASDYRAPLAVNTAFNPANLNAIGSDYGNNILMQASGLGPRDFLSANLGGPGSYLPSIGNPTAGLSGVSWGYSDALRAQQYADAKAAQANQDFGYSLNKLFTGIGNMDWGSLFNTSNTNNGWAGGNVPGYFGSSGYINTLPWGGPR